MNTQTQPATIKIGDYFEAPSAAIFGNRPQQENNAIGHDATQEKAKAIDAEPQIEPAEYPEINLQFEPQYTLEAISRYKGNISADLFKAPGFIKDLIEYSEQNAEYGCITANSIAAYAMTAFLAVRKYVFNGLTPRLYLFALAPSGAGKENGRKIITDLCFRLQNIEHNLSSMIIKEFASGQALEEHLLTFGNALIMYDEVYTLFNSLQDKKNALQAKINKALLTYYTDDQVVSRTKVFNLNSLQLAPVSNYGIVFYGNSVPSMFWTSISQDALQNGLISRCFIFEYKGKRQRNKAKVAGPIPASIIEQAARIYHVPIKGNLQAMDPRNQPDPMKVQADPEANARIEEIKDSWDNLYSELPPDLEAEAGRAQFARAAEKIIKLSLLFAISRNPDQPQICIEDVKRAEILTYHSIAELLQATKHCCATQFDKDMERIVGILQRTESKTLKRSDLLKKSKMPQKAFDLAISQLVDMEVIERTNAQANGGGAGRIAVVYTLNQSREKE